MNEDDQSELKARPLSQQAQQPQPPASLVDRNPVLQGVAEDDGRLTVSRRQDGASPPEVDEARFAAGVVKLYEALLKEPIPEQMLRLVDKLSKQERT
jgi:hypothetical protein